MGNDTQLDFTKIDYGRTSDISMLSSIIHPHPQVLWYSSTYQIWTNHLGYLRDDSKVDPFQHEQN